MKTVKPKYLGRYENKKKRYSIGARYAAVCPYCDYKNTVWPCGYSLEKIEGTNKCKHFSGLTKGEKKFIFRKSFTINKTKSGELNINGVSFGKIKFSDLLVALEDFDYNDYSYYGITEKLDKLFCLSHSYSMGTYINERGNWLEKELKKL